MKILDHGSRIIVVTAFSLFLFSAVLYSQQEKSIDAESQQKETVSGPTTTAKTETPQIFKNKAEVNPDLIERVIPSYNTHLKEILKAAEENIKKVDKEIAQGEVKARNEEREAKVREAFEKGNELYKAGNSKEAKEAWQRAVSISKDPEMKGYIEETSRRASGEDRKIKEEDARKQEEVRKEQERLGAEAREKARLEKEASRKAESEAREAARKAEIEARDRTREKARLEREAAEKAEAAAKQKARQDREDAKRAGAELKEKEEAAQLEKEASEVQNMNAAAFGKNLEGLYEEAISYYKNGDIDKAKSAFAKIVRLYPNQTTAQRYLDKEIPRKMKKLSGRR